MNKRRFFLLIALCATFTCLPAQENEIEQNMFEQMRDGDKAVVVAVHVGAEDATSRQNIDRFNARMRQAYPDRDFREAWTSRSLIRQMSANGVTYIPTPDELFSQLKKDGYTHVLIQSSNIVNCHEMQFLRYTVEMEKGHFKQIRLGEPLLSDATDYEDAVKATAEAYGSKKEANVLICNGSAEVANPQYALLDYTLHDKDYTGWFVGTTNGYPSLESLMKQLKLQKVKKVHLIPFFFAIGEQNTNEITREWAQRLQKAGYKVTTEMRCLGDVDAIMDIFENHIRHAEKYRRYNAKELKMMTR